MIPIHVDFMNYSTVVFSTSGGVFNLRQVQKHGADLTKLENLQKQQNEARFPPILGTISSPEVLNGVGEVWCWFLFTWEFLRLMMFNDYSERTNKIWMAIG